MKKILIVNKFLYPNGGSETYIFELGKQLRELGCEVQYFGMDDSRNIVGNRVNCYTSNMDFHSGKLSKLLYPFRIIYSREARKAIRKVLEDFRPEVVHLNNFNFQITPSILYEIRKYESEHNEKVKIIYTAHDYQLVCPNHMLRCPAANQNCERCAEGAYQNCIRGKCIHRSIAKSALGALEGWVYRRLGAYKMIDTVICPSEFMRRQLDRHPDLRGKTITKHNFAGNMEAEENRKNEKENYVFYFGRYSREKGVETLLKACARLPEIPFLFAGKGECEEKIDQLGNVKNLGFLTPEEIKPYIENAKFSICPSEWYENCPFSVMESIWRGTPVLGAAIGGIPELVEPGVSGELFESGNEEELVQKIKLMYTKNDYSCSHSFSTLSDYTGWFLTLCEGKRE